MNIRVGRGATEDQACALARKWARESGKYIYLMNKKPRLPHSHTRYMLTDSWYEEGLHKKKYKYIYGVPGKKQ